MPNPYITHVHDANAAADRYTDNLTAPPPEQAATVGALLIVSTRLEALAAAVLAVVEEMPR